MLTTWQLNKKSREVCIKFTSPSASLAVIGQVTGHRTVIWPIVYYTYLVMNSDGIQIKMLGDWSTSHAQRVTMKNRHEFQIIFALEFRLKSLLLAFTIQLASA